MIEVDFSIPSRIIFGRGASSELPNLIKDYGTHILIVRGAGSQSTSVVEQLVNLGKMVETYVVGSEPTEKIIGEGVRTAQEVRANAVIGIGGGSAIDTGKAIAVLMTNPGKLRDYLEVVGSGKPILNPGIPFVAIPTTSGTGSEVTKNAVIGIPEMKVKVSLRSPYLQAMLALVDPELTLSLPPEITATSGMDALTQLIEAFVSKKANRMTDALCREGIGTAAKFLTRAYHHPGEIDAREGMSWASLLSGIVLANAGLGAVHGFAGPIGGMFEAPHGAICACLLPAVVEVNFLALRNRAPQHPSLVKYEELSQIICHKREKSMRSVLAWLNDLCQSLSIPNLRDFGISAGHFGEIIEKALFASSMKANPIELTREELRLILEKSY